MHLNQYSPAFPAIPLPPTPPPQPLQNAKGTRLLRKSLYEDSGSQPVI